MPVAIKSPAVVLKLWTRAVKRHEDGKDPEEMPRKGQDQKAKIRKGLLRLRQLGSADLSKPGPRKSFDKVRDQLVKLMTRYCRYLKAARDEDKKTLPRYLKTVKQLTVVVQRLGPDDLEPGEDADAPLESLDAVDVADLDRALEEPEADAAEIDFDEEDDAGGTEEEILASGGRQPPDNSDPSGGSRPPLASESPPPEAAEFARRAAALEPLLLRTVKENRGDASKLRAAFDFAQGKAEQGAFGPALTALGALERALAQADAPAPEVPVDETPAGKVPAGKEVSVVVLQQARLAWDQTRKRIQGELQRLEQAILAACKGQDEFDYEDIVRGVRNLHVILDGLDTRLGDKLDQALNAEDSARRARLNGEAAAIVKEYLAFVNADPLMAEIDANGFTAVSVRQSALAALKLLAGKL